MTLTERVWTYAQENVVTVIRQVITKVGELENISLGTGRQYTKSVG